MVQKPGHARAHGLQRLVRIKNTWEHQIIAFVVGRSSEESLFRAAAAEPALRAERTTQAGFYAGSVRLLGGDSTAAQRLFELALDEGRPTFAEFFSATVDLRDILRGK